MVSGRCTFSIWTQLEESESLRSTLPPVLRELAVLLSGSCSVTGLRTASDNLAGMVVVQECVMERPSPNE